MRSIKFAVVLGLVLLLAARPLCAETKTVTLATLDWEPYIGEKISGHGYVYEVVAEAFKSVGYQVDIKFYEWKWAVEAAKSGSVDGLFPEYYDEGRKAEFVFSEPFPGGPVGFLSRKDKYISFPSDPRKDLTKTLQAMKQHSYGVVKEYINTKEFDSAAFLKKTEAESDEQNIERLYENRVQLIFIDKFVAQHLIKTKYPKYAKELVFLEPPLEVKPLYIVFSKAAANYEQKMKDFNEGLNNLKKKGTIDTIMKKYDF